LRIHWFACVILRSIFIASERISPSSSLILTGVIFGFIFSSARASYFSACRADKIQPSIIWLSGDLSGARCTPYCYVSAIIILGIIVLFIFSKELNILVLGEEKAATLGMKYRAD